MIASFQKAMQTTEGVKDIRTWSMVPEQIGEHGRGFMRLIGFAFFGEPSQRCVRRCVFLNERSSVVPCTRGP